MDELLQMTGLQKLWTSGDEAKLREMTAAGAKRAEIAAALGRTPASVTARANKLGVRMITKRNAKWTGEDLATLGRMLEAGDDMPAIARVLKRSQIDVAAEAYAKRAKGIGCPTS